MTTAARPARRARGPATIGLLLTAPGVFCVVWLVLPAPNRVLWGAGLVAREFGLLLIGLALGGVLAAVAAWRRGARRTPIVAVTLAAVTTVLAAGPPLVALQDARRLGVDLSLAEYATAGLAFAPAGEPSTEVYATAEGTRLHVDVYPAEQDAPAPAVVFLHGGAWWWGERSMTPRWNGWLNEQGYTVLDIEYRLDPPPTWRSAPGDVQCAVGWVRQHAGRLGVDPDGLVLMGSSAGGHLALLAGYAAGDEELPPSCEVDDTDVAAVVALYPPTDLVHNYELTDEISPLEGREVLERFTGGTPASAPLAYRVASPLNHVAPDSPPTFLVQGARDRMQSPIDTVMLADRLDEHGVAHELVWLDHAGHAFHANWGGFASQITRARLVRFLERHVVAADAPGPAP